MHTIGLTAVGPSGEALAIDIAWLGAAQPRNVFLHTTGLHGIEAYTGSAVQLALLDAPPTPGPQDAAIFVHVLNPYGMAWLRRANENNVDLNRNFQVHHAQWSGAPALYRVLDWLLNPKSAPSRDAFTVKAAAVSLRYGFARVKQAIAQGQYEYEQGLFFGGRELEEGPGQFCEWLQAHLPTTAYVFALDVHTGLGRRGTDTPLLEPGVAATDPAVLGAALERELIDPEQPSVAYTVRGNLGGALPHLLPHAQVDFVLQEIGTCPPLTVLHALREENRWHFYGDGRLNHPAKLRFREALCPEDIEWRRKAVSRGVTLARAAARWTFSGRQPT